MCGASGERVVATPLTTAQLFRLFLLIRLLQLSLRPGPKSPAGSAAKSSPPHGTSVEGRKQQDWRGGSLTRYSFLF